MQPTSAGKHYYMYLVAYDKDVSSDASGMELFYSADASLTPVGRMLVGHHISSKLIVMPSKGWKVMGICSTQCTGLADIASQSTVRMDLTSVIPSLFCRTLCMVLMLLLSGEILK